MVHEHNHQVRETAETAPGIELAAAPISELKQLRMSRRESQEKFWARFGVTQSSGSRFETGLGVPPAVAILIKLYVRGKLSDGDLLG
ncbi:MAG: helix-turn-helix transcriptional regulator [Telluria sp.]|nr:helix-turn-helix transcriptional regulator [Telluria sp.]